MVGDDIKNITAKTAQSLQTDVVSQITHGLSPKSPAEIVDKFYLLLSQHATRTSKNVSKRVNLVGLGSWDKETEEIQQTLQKLGITVNSVIDNRCNLAQFKDLGHAELDQNPPHSSRMLVFTKFCGEVITPTTKAPLHSAAKPFDTLLVIGNNWICTLS